jgi:hypothetical protein
MANTKLNAAETAYIYNLLNGKAGIVLRNPDGEGPAIYEYKDEWSDSKVLAAVQDATGNKKINIHHVRTIRKNHFGIMNKKIHSGSTKADLEKRVQHLEEVVGSMAKSLDFLEDLFNAVDSSRPSGIFGNPPSNGTARSGASEEVRNKYTIL